MSLIADTPSSPGDRAVPVLELESVSAGYGTVQVLRDINLAVPSGTIVALLGANGAGKTTLMRVAAGLLRPSAGRILLEGADVGAWAPHRRARKGLCLIPEGRGIFRSLTVSDNLRLQAPTKRNANDAAARACDVFPVLGTRLKQTAGTLSGGQQQMLALARAYLCSPSVVLMDEVSMGLAPIITDEIYRSIRAIAETGTALVLVEQYVNQALELADMVVLLKRGSVAFSGRRQELSDEALTEGYLGNSIRAGS